MENKIFNGRSFLGLVLILFGGLILLDNLNLMSHGIAKIIFSFPTFMILIGLITLFNSNRKGFSITLITIGLIFLIPEIDPTIDIDFGTIIAVVFIFAGVYVIIRHRKMDYHFRQRFFGKHDEMVNNDLLDEIAIFGGGEKKIRNENFKGGRITTVFGGNEIDLTDCKLAEGTQTIDIFTMFGGVEMHVPASWKIKHDVIPIFGGFSQKGRMHSSEMQNDSQTLFVKGIVIFGGVEVKSV